jgi:RNA polymerase sigma-70 factor (ECF subfamily)
VNRSSRDVYDELLVMRCRRRDSAAWDELIRRWNDRLLYYLRRLIDHEHDATNALQDVWLHVLRGLGTLQDGTRLAPWLYTIARRTAMNHLRGRYALHEESAPEAIFAEIDDVDSDQFQLENAELIHFGLSQLGRSEREVLTLFFLEDLSIAEMAQLLNIPAGTVKSRLFKARRDLKRVLAKEFPIHE